MYQACTKPVAFLSSQLLWPLLSNNSNDLLIIDKIEYYLFKNRVFFLVVVLEQIRSKLPRLIILIEVLILTESSWFGHALSVHLGRIVNAYSSGIFFNALWCHNFRLNKFLYEKKNETVWVIK